MSQVPLAPSAIGSPIPKIRDVCDVPDVSPQVQFEVHPSCKVAMKFARQIYICLDGAKSEAERNSRWS